MPILDENMAVAVEDEAARRPQRERPLVVVLGHLLVLGVLHDLQHPKADREHRKSDHDHILQDGEPDRDLAPVFSERHDLSSQPRSCGPAPLHSPR